MNKNKIHHWYCEIVGFYGTIWFNTSGSNDTKRLIVSMEPDGPNEPLDQMESLGQMEQIGSIKPLETGSHDTIEKDDTALCSKSYRTSCSMSQTGRINPLAH